ncbi:MAG: SUMF1/EgtB/PvdO family nonheme iron enzyme [Phycisphaeraceae bacterium]|nr:SUMF1/EgtB/PvdO family nonheme iron enzyme [Phycisphaeraceae bacterium]
MKKKLAIVIVALVALVGLVYLLIPNARDEAKDLTSMQISESDGTAQPAAAHSDAMQLSISAQNTRVDFSCAKIVAGKTLLVRGGWSERFGSEIEGTLGVDPDTHKPLTIQAKVRIDSLWSEHDMLTTALLTMGFFRPQEHPWAAFEGSFTPDDSSGAGAYQVAGDFQLNGITKRISFPVTVQNEADAIHINSAFSLDRKAFDVLFKEEGAFGLLTDSDIVDMVAVKLQVDLPFAGESPQVPPEVGQTEQPSQQPQLDVADWPAMFIETIPSTQVQFEMVLVPGVPGDSATGARPFYIGKCEVTWDEFMPWVMGNDLVDEAEVGQERALKLRPSAPYGTVDRNFGTYQRPALGMSQLAANLYCQWLSKQTGHTYRLPTEQEWEHAYAAGGGDPHAALSADEAERMATYEENSWNDSIGDWATTKVGQREPNQLGICDMAGNVAEWVTDAGDQQVVRGGHFESPAGDLVVGRIVEDQEEWNRDYPNDPKSQWWYVNARWVGFRLVCDAPPVRTSE